ncbi:MAG: nucleotide exchange factor GrpE [Aequorivita sp.]|nr:nucleotide exchange factor GrpE [Aequorivita sp.]|tara:strand:+ start:49445 stop:50005 length:561 start_codon:yes stop_codon:yes gene_type:complete
MSKNDNIKDSKTEGEVGFEEQDVQDVNEQDTTTEKKKDELTEAQENLQNEKDRYLRLFAEFENYKKRTARERIDMFKTAGEDIMISLLPVLDDFERALKEIKKNEDDSLYKGVELIKNKFYETLKSKGLELMEVKQGDAFDSESHEAITQIPAPDKKLKGKIIDVVEKGYTLGEKIIRYPKVVIGQ